MKFSAVAFALAAAVGVSASYSGNATVVTEVVDVYTTYCPGPTELTYGTKTYTVTKATTLVITDCPCTVVKPVMTTSAVVCHTCGGYSNSTMNTVPTAAPTVATPVMPTGSMVPTGAPSSVPTAGAGKAAALSGAGLLGLVGLAALL